MNSLNDQRHPAALEVHYKVSQFLKQEYRLLDEERFDEWLELFAEDVHYAMPGIENRRRENLLSEGFYDSSHMAYFDDSLRDLRRRVSRFQQSSAWAENPGTRNVHTLSNIEVFQTPEADDLIVHSVFQSVRGRGLDEQYVIHGRRRDVLTPAGDSYKIRKRLILIPNATLGCKNINTFL
ncbi:MAG: 3-phenylpropionate/cinnamic acid dioxygenase subunit beta [Gammaproteobacteria bacterium]|nr:3-phenylpropionate/cinnamic acid dioxygenase subunit beta [Gammaproteobacteria bacterium]